MTEDQFWWASVHGHDNPEIVEVTFEDGNPRRVDLIGTDNYICPTDFEHCQVRLIERVLPAGRAAVAVEKLEGERDLARTSAQKLHRRCRQNEAHIAYLERDAELDRQTIAILRGQGKRP